MEIVFRRMFQEEDLAILFSENDEEAKLLMKLGQMKARIVGRSTPSEDPNYTVSREGKIIESGFKAMLQILFKETESYRTWRNSGEKINENSVRV